MIVLRYLGWGVGGGEVEEKAEEEAVEAGIGGGEAAEEVKVEEEEEAGVGGGEAVEEVEVEEEAAAVEAATGGGGGGGEGAWKGGAVSSVLLRDDHVRVDILDVERRRDPLEVGELGHACRCRAGDPRPWGGRGGLRGPRRASARLKRRSGVRRRGLSLPTAQAGAWGGVVKQGRRQFQPAGPCRRRPTPRRCRG